MDKFQVAANVAFFLLERTGSILSQWRGKLKASEQRELFGVFLGKGTIYLDGSSEQIQHIISACFGLDYDVTFSSTWGDFPSAVARRRGKPSSRRIS